MGGQLNGNMAIAIVFCEIVYNINEWTESWYYYCYDFCCSCQRHLCLKSFPEAFYLVAILHAKFFVY